MEDKKRRLADDIWVEKYRPKRFSDALNVPEQLPKLVGKDMPHLMFSGAAGVGKSTFCKIIVDELGCDCLQLNGSDERGIDTIRDKVKEFVMTQSSKQGMFKIVYIDEADALTIPAQDILRNLMETYARNARFIFSLNYINKIIDPLQSRCVRFLFMRVNDDAHFALLKRICEAECLKHSDDVLKRIVSVVDGDMRKSINLLQQHRNNLLSIDIVKDFDVAVLFDDIRCSRIEQAMKSLMDRNVDFEQAALELFYHIIGLPSSVMAFVVKRQLIPVISEYTSRMSRALKKDTHFYAMLVRLDDVLHYKK